MRERRLKINGKVVFDYRDLLDGRKRKGKVILYMKKGPASYSDAGIRFYKDHPFNLVDTEDAERFLSLPEDGYVYFTTATVEQVEDYYVD